MGWRSFEVYKGELRPVCARERRRWRGVSDEAAGSYGDFFVVGYARGRPVWGRQSVSCVSSTCCGAASSPTLRDAAHDTSGVPPLSTVPPSRARRRPDVYVYGTFVRLTWIGPTVVIVPSPLPSTDSEPSTKEYVV